MAEGREGVAHFPLLNGIPDTIPSLAEGCLCIQMKSVDVPVHTAVGSGATLGCNFDLGKDKLYSVKWYKDSSEFYRLSL